jgi:hypothetical protein
MIFRPGLKELNQQETATWPAASRRGVLKGGAPAGTAKTPRGMRLCVYTLYQNKNDETRMNELLLTEQRGVECFFSLMPVHLSHF